MDGYIHGRREYKEMVFEHKIVDVEYNVI